VADAESTLLPEIKIWKHSPVVLRPNAARTVLKPFAPDYPEPYRQSEGSRARKIVERLLSVDQGVEMIGLKHMTELLGQRHRDVETILLRRYDELGDAVPDRSKVSRNRALLIGAFFTEEYSFEAAALFNPSIVPHWDQSGIGAGCIRFILSLRGIGEGHVSSVTFRTGVWSADGEVSIDDPSPYAVPPLIEPMEGHQDEAALCLSFEGTENLSEAVLFPMAPSQRQGIEDLRLVLFKEDDGSSVYRGTYTAFSGAEIRQEVLSTHRFDTFSMRPLEGKAVANKGMALFPRRIDGRYRMLGRQDNENVWLMRSDDLHVWDEAEKLFTPQHPWEFVQMGNCGSPIEIDEGWLVITHGVGMVRNYTISAYLLDKQDPSKILARPKQPILRPTAADRDGYVPNVVYSCGSLVHGRRLLMPYGVADHVAMFATTTVEQVLDLME
jgi:predicted GH43/DUF377 family glycosyl hydrolase